MSKDQVITGYDAIVVAIEMLCETLTDSEMATIGLRLAMGSSFKDTPFEERISAWLDTQGNMHDLTEKAFWHVYNERFLEEIK